MRAARSRPAAAPSLGGPRHDPGKVRASSLRTPDAALVHDAAGCVFREQHVEGDCAVGFRAVLLRRAPVVGAGHAFRHLKGPLLSKLCSLHLAVPLMASVRSAITSLGWRAGFLPNRGIDQQSRFLRVHFDRPIRWNRQFARNVTRFVTYWPRTGGDQYFRGMG